jgi:hypothetical protein
MLPSKVASLRVAFEEQVVMRQSWLKLCILFVPSHSSWRTLQG